MKYDKVVYEHMLHQFLKRELTANCKEYAQSTTHMFWLFPLIKNVYRPQ